MAKAIPPAIVSTAFNLSMKKGKSVGVVVLTNGDSAVVKLEAVHDADYAKATDKQRQELMDNMTKVFGSLDYQLYVKGARDRAKVKVVGE